MSTMATIFGYHLLIEISDWKLSIPLYRNIGCQNVVSEKGFNKIAKVKSNSKVISKKVNSKKTALILLNYSILKNELFYS